MSGIKAELGYSDQKVEFMAIEFGPENPYSPEGMRRLGQIINNFIDTSGDRFTSFKGRISENKLKEYFGTPGKALADLRNGMCSYLEYKTIKRLDGKLPKPDGKIADGKQEFFTVAELEQIARDLQHPTYTKAEWDALSNENPEGVYTKAIALIRKAMGSADIEDVRESISDIEELLNGKKPAREYLLYIAYAFASTDHFKEVFTSSQEFLDELTIAYGYPTKAVKSSELRKDQSHNGKHANGNIPKPKSDGVL